MLLDEIKTFNCAARCGSFSRAAKELHLSQSAVTHQVKLLEERTGLKLYERHRRGITLTRVGEIFNERAQQVLAQLNELEDQCRILRGEEVECIAIASQRGISRYKLPIAMKAFKQRYPSIRLQLYNKIRDNEIISMVTTGQVDFGITTSWNDFGNLTFHEFLSCNILFCVRDDHPLKEEGMTPTRLTLRRIAKEPLLLYEQGSAIHDRIVAVFEAEGIAIRTAVETGGADVLKEYVRAGVGAAIVSSLTFERGPEEDIYTVGVSRHFGQVGYGFIFRNDKYFSPPVVELMNLLDPQLVLEHTLKV